MAGVRESTLKADLVIGLDCSTTASKAIVWDAAGTALGEGRYPLRTLAPRAGWHEQPAESWWEATCEAVRQALQPVDVRRVAALCITAQRETFVPVGEDGSPLRPGIVWMDERAGPLLPSLEKSWGKESFHRVTGKPLSVNLTIAKIAWLRRHEPEIFSRTLGYLDVAAFLVQRLCGFSRTGWGCADPTGMFDMTQNSWAQALIETVGVRAEQLPEAFPPGEILGNVTATAARETGLPAGTPIVAGVGDGQSSGLGVGITQPGQAYLALGTSVIAGVLSPHYVVNPAFRTMYGGLTDTFMLEAPLLGGGYTIEWFMRELAASTDQETLEREASRLPPGSEGLVLVPYWNSVLGPYWDAAASGIVVGWRGIHRPVHLYRAILEGIAFEQRLAITGVETATGQPIELLVAVGGGAHSDLWCQTIADVTGKPVARSSTAEAAALGAGVLAAVAAGLHADVAHAAQAMTRVQGDPMRPDPWRHERYSRLYEEVYLHLFPALQPHLRRLAGLSNPAVSDE
jgi:sugar (pentulose or hexulose) kinase